MKFRAFAKLEASVRDHCRAWRYRRTLERDRARIVAEIADRLRAYPNDNVAPLERRLHLNSHLVRALEPLIDRSSRLVAVVLSIVLALLLWKLPLLSTTVVATIDAEAVRFKLAADWAADVELPLAAPVHLDGLTALTSPALFKGIQSTAGDAWLAIPATVERISLDHLSLEKGTSIELERLGPALNVYLTGPARGRLALEGPVEGQVGRRDNLPPIEIEPQTLVVPERVDFRARGGSIIAMMLPARPDRRWAIRSAKIDGISFSKETSPGPGRSSFKSSITSGKVSLYDVNDSFQLSAFDSLSLEAFVGTIVELRGDPGQSMRVMIKGTARRVLRGIDETSSPQDLTPSFLQYLYHQRSSALLALGIPWLWAMLANLRKVIFP